MLPHMFQEQLIVIRKESRFTPHEIKSILVTTSDIITDEYKKEFEFDAGGAGRIDLKKAFNSELIFEPPKLIFNLSEHKTLEENEIKISSLYEISIFKK